MSQATLWIDELYPEWTCTDLDTLDRQWTDMTEQVASPTPIITDASLCISKGSFGITIARLFFGKVLDVSNESRRLFNIELEALKGVMNTRDVLLLNEFNQKAVESVAQQQMTILENDYNAYEDKLKTKMFTRANSIRTYIEDDNSLDHHILPLLDLDDEWVFKSTVSINDIYDAIDRVSTQAQQSLTYSVGMRGALGTRPSGRSNP